ncbi:MAG: xanthine dehydrogenase family protein subunit M [Alphaproteobacteria bacterium]|nr:xanthine dehydrogenase family protein subunit M [Alphaproteobacteria bacterium]
MTKTDFQKPKTVEEAVTLLKEAGDDARPISGGATLVALMNARLVQPSRLVSLSAIDELTQCTYQSDGSVRIGAMRRHRQTAFESNLKAAHQVVSGAASQIANPPVRNMGTIGGSISFADPAADYPPSLVAANAEIEIAGPEGRRRIPAEEFFLGWYETALEPGEIVTAVILPPVSESSVGQYEKLCRIAGDFALASVAVTIDFNASNTVTSLRLAVGGCGGGPIRVEAAEQALIGTKLELDAVVDAAELVVAELDPIDDVRGSAEYRLKVVPRLLQRAFNNLVETREPAQ